MKSTNSAAKRYKRHLDAIAGEQTTDEFRKSPYYVERGPYGGWAWNDFELRCDQATLAKAYVEEDCAPASVVVRLSRELGELREKYEQAMEQHGFTPEFLSDSSIAHADDVARREASQT